MKAPLDEHTGSDVCGGLRPARPQADGVQRRDETLTLPDGYPTPVLRHLRDTRFQECAVLSILHIL